MPPFCILFRLKWANILDINYIWWQAAQIQAGGGGSNPTGLQFTRTDHASEQDYGGSGWVGGGRVGLTNPCDLKSPWTNYITAMLILQFTHHRDDPMSITDHKASPSQPQSVTQLVPLDWIKDPTVKPITARIQFIHIRLPIYLISQNHNPNYTIFVFYFYCIYLMCIKI